MTTSIHTSTDIKTPEAEYEEIGGSPGALQYTRCPVFGLSLMNGTSEDMMDQTTIRGHAVYQLQYCLSFVFFHITI